MELTGQLLGKYEGTHQGIMFINIDKGQSEGTLALFGENKIHLFCRVVVKNHEDKFFLELLNFLPINPVKNSIDTWCNPHICYPKDFIAPYSGKLIFSKKLNEYEYEGTWETNTGGYGNFHGILESVLDNQKSAINSTDLSWEEFKKTILIDADKYVFRGQPVDRPLRTTFHRTGRCNLIRYANNDVHVLSNTICAVSNRIYNLNNPFEYGALLYLAQHHGFPTPLLDWSVSPYIAAFFAYNNIGKTCKKVRIFKFDAENWRQDHAETAFNFNIDIQRPVLIMRDFLAINNNRALPQQARSMFSNVSNIEAFIRNEEKLTNKKYLEIYELSVDYRKEVINDLRLMGITAASLFPGLSGACEALKEELFNC